MVKRTGPTNQNLLLLIRNLKKLSNEKKVNIWRRIAKDLERPTRIRRRVNLFTVEKNLKQGEIAVIPGKLLSLGNLSKKHEISAYQASEKAIEKIQKSGSKFLTLQDLMKSNPQGKKVRILG